MKFQKKSIFMFCRLILILQGLTHIYRSENATISRAAILTLWDGIEFALTEDFVGKVLKDKLNDTEIEGILHQLHVLNKTFDYEAAWKSTRGISFLQEDQALPSYNDASGNPHCDSESTGPRFVTKEVRPQTSNPFNKIPTFTFDIGQLTTDILNRAASPGAAQAGATGIIAMAGIMMVKDMIQSALSTAVSLVPPAIPPPVWNNMPLPCVPMITGGNCFGSVLYPITFADSIIADVTDSVLTGLRGRFRATFLQRAGKQPDSVYQLCYKAYMSLMCSDRFPRCTNPQGRDEMVPFLGRVPTCFTACIAVLAACPGFTFADIGGVCSEVSVPPICSQAVYLRDDPQGVETIEEEIAGKLNSKCSNYNPEIDAGEDPLLYETEPTEKLFEGNEAVQKMIS
jgi:hypothetical protein